ncbi:putative HNHc nuclease [Anaerovibrio sp. RM50]|uniref:putative HNHc nuclease n=1 Tax=Anaerovibrio sp. RM50 TaxID=1200557 RepID=UPI00048A0A8A|nr:putative HNHc nuclease [Anaerovibrio sp. RM50]
MQDIVTGKIVDMEPDGSVHIVASVPDIDRAVNRKYSTVLIGFNDGRRISAKQRAKAHCLIAEIADWMAELPALTKQIMKVEFKVNRLESLETKMFSLSNCDMNTASEFISYLVDFVVENDIPTRKPMYQLADDIGKYMYACLVNKRCCICGQAGQLHHCEGSRIGMGGDRKEVHHLGRDVACLCWKHHDELHRMAETEFMDKYHIYPIQADKVICKKYKLKE